MSIQQYYQKTAYSYVNALIVSGILLTILLFACLLLPSRPPFGLLVIPFVLFFIVQFQGFLRFYRHAKNCECEATNDAFEDFFSYQDFLLTLAPAPALRLLLFHPNGQLAGEIKETNPKLWRWFLPNLMDYRLKKDFGLYDHQGKLLAVYRAKNKDVELLDKGRNVVAVYEDQLQSGKVMETGVEYMKSDDSAVYTDLRMLRGSQLVSRLQKGWMPVGWSKTFSVNTPILSFETSVNQTDKLLAFAAVISHYQYENH